MKRTLLSFFLFCVSALAGAYDFFVDGIYYTKISNNTVEVTSGNYSGNITIPNSIKFDGIEYRVTSIGSDAFSGCSGLTSIKISNSVTNIGTSAFYGCSGLTSVTIPNSVTSIGDHAFNDCSGLPSITIPNSVTSIGRAAFANCSGLPSITIPNSVTTIGSDAFSGCSGLTSINIPNSVTSIESNPIRRCKNITIVEVEGGNPKYDSRNNCNAIIESSSNTLISGCKKTVIPNGVTDIGYGAFYGCSGLTSITIPNSVTTIGSWAFYDCSGLTSVIIPNNVTSIGSEAFMACESITIVDVDEGNPKYDSRNNCNAIIETFSNTLILGCKNTVIPNNVTSIGESAFYGCSGLASITIPNGVTSIGDRAFLYCSGLTSITIPNSVTTIGSGAFSRCSGLPSITIPNSVTSIGGGAFYGCFGLTSITIPYSVTSIGGGAFTECYHLTNVTAESTSPTAIEQDAFKGISSNASLQVPQGTKSKYQELTGWSKYFKQIVEVEQTCSFEVAASGNGTVKLGNNSIKDNTSSFTVNRGDSKTLIFTPDSGNRLASVKVNGVDVTSQVSNNQYTISNINASTTVVVTFEEIPLVKNFEVNGIFYNMLSYNTVEVTQAPTGKSYSGDIDIPSTIVYEGAEYTVVSIGKSAFYNSTKVTSVSIPSSVTNISTSAFEGCSGMTSVTVPNSVDYIGNQAFLKCSKLKTINIPTSLTSIGMNVFYMCSNLASVTIPNGVTTIGSGAFYRCSSLTSVNIPASLKSLEGNAFQGCNSLSSITVASGNPVYDSRNNCNAIIETATNTLVFGCKTTTIPNTVTMIEGGSFYGCTVLTSLVIPYGVKKIGEEAFWGCTGLTTVTIASSVTTIENNAFQGCSSLRVVNAESTSPSAIATEAFNGISSDASLQVPQGTKSKYQALTGWSKYFKQIVEAKSTYSLEITATGKGTVTFDIISIKDNTYTSSVNKGASQTLTFTPDFGYRLASVKLNNVDVTSSVVNNQYTISNILTDMSVVVTFEAIPAGIYSLAITVSDGGMVTFGTDYLMDKTVTYTMTEGSSATLVFSPNPGFRVGSVKVNGTDVTTKVTNGLYTVDNISQHTTVVVTFEEVPASYTLGITVSAGGTVTYNGGSISNRTSSYSVEEGNSVTLTITPNTGYRLKSVKMNDEDVTANVANGKYTINGISRNTTVVVEFEVIPPTMYQMTLTVSAGGSVSYNGGSVSNKTSTYSVEEGKSATLAINPDTGYRLKSVKVGDVDVTSQVKDGQYTLNGIKTNFTISVTFEQIPECSLTIIATGSGSVVYGEATVQAQSRSFSVEVGASAKLVIKPNAGYRIATVKVNEQTVASQISGTEYIYEVKNITSDTTVEVTFEEVPVATCSLGITVSAGGTVSYNGESISNKTKTYSVEKGKSIVLTFSPATGYRIESVVVNGQDVTSQVTNGQYSLGKILANTTVEVTFEVIPPTTYQLTITASGNGTASYGGTIVSGQAKTVVVEEGTLAAITFSPDEGHRIASVKVNGQDVTAQVVNGQYSLGKIQANTTVEVTFEVIPPTTYQLTITASGNGSASYEGTTVSGQSKTVVVGEGTQAAITFSPDEGHRIASVKVNGQDVTAQVVNGQYTLDKIQANTTVEVTFEEIPPTTYQLTITASGNGTVSYEGTTVSGQSKTVVVVEGTQAVITFSPDEGHRIASVKVNGQDVTAQVVNGQYTLDKIQANTTVEATFEVIPPTTYQLTITASGNGTASYEGTTVSGQSKTVVVVEGTLAVITFTPDDGQRIASVKVNGQDVTAQVVNGQLTLDKIQANTTVEVTFEVIPPTTYQLTITASGNGTASYEGTAVSGQSKTLVVVEGTLATITFSPDEGQRIGSVKVNGQDITSQVTNWQYTIDNVVSNTTVEVVFVEDIKALTSDDVNYAVVSYDEKTVEVASGDYGLCLTVPASFQAKGMTWSVVGIAEDALKNSKELAAVVWNPSVAFTATVTNPNLLLYVVDRRFAPSTITNVIENGMAVNGIVLKDAANGNNFYCPREFTTANISYTHHYGMTTGIGESRGWESIALPFDVTTVATAKGTLVPFAKWQEGDGERPFWLYELGTTSFVEADGIKANTPYIISMPNNERYAEDYRVAGEVTFSAENVKVLATPDLSAADGLASANGRHFVPNYVCRQPENGVYTLNVNNLFENALGGFLEGSMFVRNLRQLHPFEAYITMEETNAKAAIPVFEDGTSGIRGIELFADKTNGRVHNLNGQQVKLDDDGLDRLPMGVYIINGQKIVVK